jgi:hypothetical protein
MGQKPWIIDLNHESNRIDQTRIELCSLRATIPVFLLWGASSLREQNNPVLQGRKSETLESIRTHKNAVPWLAIF